MNSTVGFAYALIIIVFANFGSAAGFAEKHGDRPTTYQMRQNLISFGDDFWIENAKGQRVFKVDGKMLRVRDTLFFEDRKGKTFCKIQGRIARVKDTMEIEDNHDKRMALVQKALITPLRDRWLVKIGNGPDIEVHGDIFNHEYTIGKGRHKIAEVSKKWFRLSDTYGVKIQPGSEDLLILAITVAIDMMAHE